MKLILLIPFFTISLFLASCSKEKVVNVTEVRESIGTGDELFVYTEMVPDGWRMVGSVGSAFTRPVASYAVGEKSLVTLTPSLKGEYLGNINRWKKQFGNDEVESLDDLESVILLEEDAVFVKEVGTFQGKHEGWAMLVAMNQHSKYGLCVLKMVGPEDEVLQQEENFKKVAKQLKIRL